jgi:hypothetical protein
VLSYCSGLSLEIGKLGFKRHEAGRTMVCVATEVMPVSRYSSIEGMLPVLPQLDSVNHEANVSYHFIQKRKKDKKNKRHHIYISQFNRYGATIKLTTLVSAYNILKIVYYVTSFLLEVFCGNFPYEIIKGIEDNLTMAAQTLSIPPVIYVQREK